MTGFTLSTVCHCGLLTFIVLFSFTSFVGGVSFDLTDLRNKVAKIKVNPRGNLWATGHFMGKKSVMEPSAEEQDAKVLGVALPAEQDALAELFHQFLRVALQAQVETHESRSKKPELGLVAKILENYIQSRK